MRTGLTGVLTCALFSGAIVAAAPTATPTVVIVPNLPSPQRVGTSIGLEVRLENAPRGKYEYRYSESVAGGPYHVISDFSPKQFFVWTPALYEHESRVRATVRNAQTQEAVEGELPYRITSRVTSQAEDAAVVTATGNPLVALFSQPPCPAGGEFQVAFMPADSTDASHASVTHTSKQACRGSVSNNVYVAGMHADVGYKMRSEITDASGMKSGPWLSFHTGLVDGSFPVITVSHARSGGAASNPVSVWSLPETGHTTATDQAGDMIWYMRGPEWLTRMLPGGLFLTIANGENSENKITRLQLIREIDLAGNVLRETNIRAVAEQLASRGIKSSCKKGSDECVSGFHHEVIQLPNGHILAIAGLERMYPDGTQGAKGPVDILGDLVFDLDENFQVVWVWNSFEHMDLKRKSVSDEKCQGGEGSGGCPPVFLADQANGWLHSNSLDYIPTSGDFLISIPEQNWVVKIDYKNGKGTGDVLWRLGADGDFQVKSDDPSPWFSYQHDARFEGPGSDRMTLIDDGHRRREKDPKANSRGQMWQVDEQAKIATLLYNADLGVYTAAVGSAQTLPNGSYSFEGGLINPGPALYCREVETDASRNITYSQQMDGLVCYRSFRVPDLYSTPNQ